MDIIVVIFAAIWAGIYYYALTELPKYSKTFNQKSVRNCVSVLHCSGVIFTYFIVSCLMADIADVYYFSASYYFYDLFLESYHLYNMIKAKQQNKAIDAAGMIVHHLIGVLTMDHLYNLEIQNLLFWGFTLAEISNIPLYAVHHIMASGLDEKVKNKWLKLLLPLEIASFGFLRGIGLFYFLILGLGTLPITIYLCSLVIYALSMVWLAKLCKQYWAALLKSGDLAKLPNVATSDEKKNLKKTD